VANIASHLKDLFAKCGTVYSSCYGNNRGRLSSTRWTIEKKMRQSIFLDESFNWLGNDELDGRIVER
jgi:hypothetical protein